MKNSNNTLHYKGFTGLVTFSLEDACMHGRIEYINDLVTFEAERVADLKVEFEDAVDDYIETCAEIGKSPNKPMSGSFNVRVGAELHKSAHRIALEKGVSLNDMVKESINQAVRAHAFEKKILHLRMREYKSIFQMPGTEAEEPKGQSYKWTPNNFSFMTSGAVQ